MKVVFLGTPDFAVPVLKSIVNSNHEVVAVITQPDRAGNRGKVLPCATKETATSLGLPVYSYERIRNNVEELKSLGADVFVTCAYGQILTQEILDIPRYGILNVHGSLLPKYRGSSPIQWALINGEKETGITIMRTALGVDSGDIFLQQAIDIQDDDNAESLFDKLSILGADMIVKALDMLERGEGAFVPQDESQATHYPMLTKQDGEIDFAMTSRDILNRYRGLSPWPSLYTYLDGEMCKVFDIVIVDAHGKPGEVIVADSKRGLVVATGDSAISCSLQIAGGKRMPIADFLRGRPIKIGTILGK